MIKPQKSVRALSDADYDQNGKPIGRITVSWHCYELWGGPQSSWVAAYDDLPGYHGEAASVEEAIERLWQSFGPRPHYKVDHKFRSAKKLQSDIRQRRRAMAAALVTRAPAWGVNLGASSEAVDEAAKEFGVGKPSVNEAHKLLKVILEPHRDDSLIVGVSRTSLEQAAKSQLDRTGDSVQLMELELAVAREAPWRIEHADARRKIPSENQPKVRLSSENES